eukprot:371562-Pleurochrysis_carterae.AAC.1
MSMRSNFSHERPAQPILYLDGTGQALGKGLGHAELGSADFNGSCKQSRATLEPLAGWAGTDHADSLRENTAYALRGFNKLIKCKELHLADGRCVPCEPAMSADFQAVKACFAMDARSHSVWCTCQKGAEGSQHRYSKKLIKLGTTNADFEKAYASMMSYIESDVNGPQCAIKTFDRCCRLNHLSPGLARGGAFTPVDCPCCGYNPSEKQLRDDIAAFEQLTDAEQKRMRKAHMEDGVEVPQYQRHHFGLLFMAPIALLDLIRCGADTLHLVYLNMFKHLFKYTIHEALPDSRKSLVRDYVKAANFYSYDPAAVDGEDPTSRWIGREVKRFIEEAETHLPFLLRLAAAPPDVTEDVAAFVNGAHNPFLSCESYPHAQL